MEYAHGYKFNDRITAIQLVPTTSTNTSDINDSGHIDSLSIIGDTDCSTNNQQIPVLFQRNMLAGCMLTYVIIIV
jgi:hypothetical protein